MASENLIMNELSILNNDLRTIERTAPPLIDRVHPLHDHTLQPCSGQAKRVSYMAVRNPSFQSLFTPIETILYFFKKLQTLLGGGHPISENQYSPCNLQKDCVSPSLKGPAVLRLINYIFVV